MTTDGQQGSARNPVAPAIFLWVLVLCGLLYGVVETATKLPALFGG
jgi:hypothetical protein